MLELTDKSRWNPLCELPKLPLEWPSEMFVRKGQQIEIEAVGCKESLPHGVRSVLGQIKFCFPHTTERHFCSNMDFIGE